MCTNYSRRVVTCVHEAVGQLSGGAPGAVAFAPRNGTDRGGPAAMNFDLLTGLRPLLLLLATDAVLLVFLAYPLRCATDDDQGDGLALVLLPKPKLPSFWAVPAFACLFLVLMLTYHSLRGTWTRTRSTRTW